MDHFLQFAVRSSQFGFGEGFCQADPMPSSAFGERLDRQAFLGPWMGTFLGSTAPKDAENRKSHRGIPIGFFGIYQWANFIYFHLFSSIFIYFHLFSSSFIYFHLFSTSEFTGWPSTMIWLDNPCWENHWPMAAGIPHKNDVDPYLNGIQINLHLCCFW